MADATITGTDYRPSLASGAAFFGVLILAWATYVAIESWNASIPPGYCNGDCGASYTSGELLLLRLLLYSAIGYGVINRVMSWRGVTAFLTVIYAGCGTLLAGFMLLRYGPLWGRTTVILALLGTALMTYAVFICPDPLRSAPS
jgi:hypothetical protein